MKNRYLPEGLLSSLKGFPEMREYLASPAGLERAKNEGINAIFIQPQYSIDKVRAIAEACDAEVVITDPLSKDILTEIERITDIICSYEPRDTH